jgi:hypothetical protein
LFGAVPNQWRVGYENTPNTDGTPNSFKVDTGSLTSDDWGGEGIFVSQTIDISSISSFSIEALGNTVGSDVFNNLPTENFQWAYSIDQGTPVPGPQITSDGSLNSPASWTDIPATGNTLNIIFRFNINGSGDGFDISQIKVTGVSAPTTYTFDGGTWTPNNPITGAVPSTASNDIEILSGTAIINGELIGNKLTVASGATLEMDAPTTTANTSVLNIACSITNNGNIIFKSDANGSAQLDELSGAYSGTGNVEVQRYIPAGDNDLRAFRFLSTAVDSDGTIRENWQEGATSNTDDPNPGFGTHITGTTATDGTNGFDATESGEASLLLFDNASQSWSSIANTDNTNLQAGYAYNLFVRGDRNVDLSLNSDNQTPTNTILRSTGDLATGLHTTGTELPALATGNEEWSFVGNPYQAIVDFNSLTFTGDVKDTFFYIWNPNASTQGMYEAIDNATPAQQMIQPGQSFFVQNSATVATQPEIEFTETAKNTTGNVTTVFSDNELAIANLELYNNNNTRLDVMKFRFVSGADNGLDDYDAGKIGNPTENLASVNNSTLLSIERRDLPTAADTIALFTNQYQSTNYEFQLNTSNWDDSIDIYLKDDYTEEVILLESDESISFTVDSNIPESIATDRFSLIFENTTLGVDNSELANQISLYPNPSEGQFSIQTRDLGTAIDVNIYNMAGKQVFHKSYQETSEGELKVKAENLASGVYMLEMNTTKESYTTRLIIK